MRQINDFITVNKDRFLSELIDLLKIPSVSADSKYKVDILKCAEMVKQRMVEAGIDHVEIFSTKGNPIVYGEKIIDKSLPTILVYGHYDVQPADPINLWTSSPFEPVIVNEKIVARGSADDKGQFYMHIKAFEAMLKTGTLACNVKMMIEGEEEVGSENLPVFVKANIEKLKADVVIISDTALICK
jgi:acetylornithine deacetylase/succinyl-diaminopimelate desuccinylase-like protein